MVLDNAYDGTLLASQTWSGAASGKVSFGYDDSFRVTSETVTAGSGSSTVSFGHDPDGMVTCASIGPTPCTPPTSCPTPICSATSDDVLRLCLDCGSGLALGSSLHGVTDSLTYSGFGELASYSAVALGNTVFSEALGTRDALGRIVDRVETNGGAPVSWHYAYDLHGRLSDVTKNGTLLEHYDYDANGNRKLAGNEVYDAQDRLLTYGSTTFTYTPNGELKTKTDASGTTTYTYDGRLHALGYPARDTMNLPNQGLEHDPHPHHRTDPAQVLCVTDSWVILERMREVAATARLLQRLVRRRPRAYACGYGAIERKRFAGACVAVAGR